MAQSVQRLPGSLAQAIRQLDRRTHNVVIYLIDYLECSEIIIVETK